MRDSNHRHRAHETHDKIIGRAGVTVPDSAADIHRWHSPSSGTAKPLGSYRSHMGLDKIGVEFILGHTVSQVVR